MPTTPDERTGTATPADPPLLLRSRYLLEERIASGGMASVWRAHDEALGRTVAVKVLHEHLAADPDFRERFRREAVAAAKLTHPGIVALYDTGTDGDRVFLVMEYVDGPTLRDVVADGGALDVAHACGIVQQAANALHVAHREGLVHRDVKPANILVTSEGAVKVADFGIAKADSADAMTRTGTVLGTAAYVAPEQVLGDPVGPAADQYALGVVLYELLTGTQPFRGDSAVAVAAQRLERDPLAPRNLRADVPRGLDTIVTTMLARSPEQRFSDLLELAEALEPYADTSAERTAALAVLEPVNRPGDELDQTAFLQTEGRWLAPVLALLLVAGGLVVAGLATGVLERTTALPSTLAERLLPSDDEGDAGGGGERGIAEPALLIPPAPAAARSFDPQGSDGVENEERLPGLFDGSPENTWRTVGYNSADFGNLKDGVGFWVDLGRPHRLDRVELRTTTPGVSYEVRVADEPSPTIDGWETVAGVEGSSDHEVISLDGPTGRYLLIWVTGDLQPSGGRFAAEFWSLEVRGAPV